MNLRKTLSIFLIAFTTSLVQISNLKFQGIFRGASIIMNGDVLPVFGPI